MRILLTFIILTVFVACAQKPERKVNLYEQLGGQAGIVRLVDEFVFRLLNDARIAEHFAETDLDRFREKLVEQFCVEVDGPCTYTGDTMSKVHQGLGITRADFDALVEDLQIAMAAQHVPVAAQNRLLKRLAPMYEEVVEERPTN